MSERKSPSCHRVIAGVAGAAFAAALLSCDLPSRSGTDGVRDTSRAIRSAALADTVPIALPFVGDTVHLRRIVVRFDDFADTLPHLLTMQEPVVDGDSAVYGITWERTRPRHGFRYLARRREVERVPFPEPLQPTTIPVLSPDGRFLAYLADDSTGWAHPLVVRWPDGGATARGPSIPLLETDGGVEHISWFDPDSVEFLVQMTVRHPGTLRVLARTRTGTTRVDTLPQR